MQLAFGAGVLYGERTDTTGSGIGPQQFGVLQSCTVDFDWTTRQLWGQNQFPVDIARGQCNITGRASFAQVFGAIYRDLCFGATSSTGQIILAANEAATVPASSAYTVTPANSATFVDDLGVYYAAGANAGKRFSRVTSPSAAGQYSVNETTGVYTFASPDASAAVLISYMWNSASTGSTINLTNQLMGKTPTFKASFRTEKNTQGTTAGLTLVLNACTSSKLSMPTRLDDYQIQEFDFMAFSDTSGSVGTLSTLE